jgi:hypothetical protein
MLDIYIHIYIHICLSLLYCRGSLGDGIEEGGGARWSGLEVWLVYRMFIIL